MTVRAKFVCNSITITNTSQYDSASGKYNIMPLKSYKFYPVTSGSDENKAFFSSTPTGSVELGTVNPAVEFEIGKEYYLDFTPAVVPAT